MQSRQQQAPQPSLEDAGPNPSDRPDYVRYPQPNTATPTAPPRVTESPSLSNFSESQYPPNIAIQDILPVTQYDADWQPLRLPAREKPSVAELSQPRLTDDTMMGFPYPATGLPNGNETQQLRYNLYGARSNQSNVSDSLYDSSNCHIALQFSHVGNRPTHQPSCVVPAHQYPPVHQPQPRTNVGSHALPVTVSKGSLPDQVSNGYVLPDHFVRHYLFRILKLAYSWYH